MPYWGRHPGCGDELARTAYYVLTVARDAPRNTKRRPDLSRCGASHCPSWDRTRNLLIQSQSNSIWRDAYGHAEHHAFRECLSLSIPLQHRTTRR